jgi:endonuclease/exonuclease/phosphatase family metal-dependent hydrolase
MQDWNAFHLYIDADNDSSTGINYHGIGAELDWTFGQRYGTQYFNGSEAEVWQNDLTLRIGPTITSTEFEIAISRESNILTMNDSQVFVEGKIVIAEAPPNSDMVPNESGGIFFNIGEDNVPEPTPISFERNNPTDVRIITYNTLNEGMIDPDREPHFRRLMQALAPDVIAIQEHWEQEEIDDIVQSWFPQEQWHGSLTYRDLVVLTRYPILHDANMISSERTMAALLDTEEELGVPLLIFNSHLSCCSNNEDRQDQVDDFISVWRDWISEQNGPFDLAIETPFVHVGDFNFVGYRQQVETLRTGDIEDESQYGEDFLPDWDESPVVDLFPRHTHKRMGYTWRKDWSSYNPGKLDYIFYSDFMIDTGKSFIVNTLAMDEVTLDEYGLQWDDTQEASDHLPIVFDIEGIIISDGAIDDENDLPDQFAILNHYPNPFNPKTTLSMEMNVREAVTIEIVDINGRLIESVYSGLLDIRIHEFVWDGTNQSSGIYFIKVQSGDSFQTRKMILLK